MSNKKIINENEFNFGTKNQMQYNYEEPDYDYEDLDYDCEEEENQYEYEEELMAMQNAEEFKRNKNEEEELIEMQNEEELERMQNEEFIKQQKKIGLMCNCELNTILRDVKKEGPNKGRQFYTCSNIYDKKCNYFMWKDESDKKMGKKVEPPVKAEIPFIKKINNEPDLEIDYKHQQKIGLMCYCKLPSVEREVKKEGPTKGKIFYTCSRYYDDKCKYFVWK